MIKCIAVDDEPLAIALLKEYISKIPFLELVTTCSDAFEAGKALQQNEVDLIFIDIQMPGLTGLQFLHSLPRRPMAIIITAYKKFALEGFDLDVVDYMLKPVSLERFMKACYKAQELCNLRRAATQSAQPGQPPAQPADYFFVNVGYSLVKILFDDISWIEGSGDYVKMHLHSAPKPLLVRTSTKALETELPPDRFLRIHKSYIVSIASITAVRKNSIFIGDLELPVGESFRDALTRLTKRNF